MKKLTIVLVALTSVSAYAFPTKEQVKSRLNAGVDHAAAALDAAKAGLAKAKAGAYPQQSSSWEQLRADRKILIGNPFNQAFGKDGAFNACYTSSELQSKDDVAGCAELETIQVYEGEGITRTDQRCKTPSFSKVHIPRSYDAKVCLEDRVRTDANGGGIDYPFYECVRWGTKPVNTPTSYNLDVSLITSEGGIQFLFTKSYDLDPCK